MADGRPKWRADEYGLWEGERMVAMMAPEDARRVVALEELAWDLWVDEAPVSADRVRALLGRA